MTSMFIADPNLPDNVCKPLSFESDAGEEVVFGVSQSRTGDKKEGQDCVSAVLRGRWECVVLCDGHDLHGHLVSRGICEALAPLLLEKLEEAGVPLESDAAEKVIIEAFDVCERDVMWSNTSLGVHSFVRILAGEWAGRVGYVSDAHEDDTFSVIVVDRDSYHRPRLPRGALTGSKYVGGSTCVAFVRDSQANMVRVAIMGDTRALVVNAKTNSVLPKDPIWENIAPGCYLTFPHDVFNSAELNRLRREWYGEFEIDGPYLINPLTGCEIQPTRGFGDFDMFGTGYLCTPDVSRPFPLEPNCVFLCASDGIFDDIVWPKFGDICQLITSRVDKGMDLEQIATDLHKETVKLAMAGEYVDDISFFMCRGARPEKSTNAPPASTSPSRKSGAGLPPLPPRRSGVPTPNFADGVDGLPTPKSSFMSSGSFSYVTPRESATLSEAAAGRRISVPGIPAKEPQPPSPVFGATTTTTTTTLRNSTSARGRSATELSLEVGGLMSSSALKRASTTEYVDMSKPRYLKEKRSESQHAHLTVRRSRGPSYLLPEGLDIFDDPAVVAAAAKQLGANNNNNNSNNAANPLPKAQIDLQTIGEDAEFIAAQQKLGLIPTPADGVRHAVAAARRRLTAPSADLIRDALAGKAEAKTPAVNAILKRMAERYGHDPSVLDDMVKDLAVV